MDAIRLILMYFVVPVWFLAGFADWLCHRRTHIAVTAGPKESVIHLLMFAELGLPLVLALFLEINALLILIMIVAFLVHEVTTWWDLSYASRHRIIKPIEQQVHSFLELMPLLALTLVVALHWDQFLALWGFGEERARFELVLRDPPLAPLYLTSVLVAALVLEVLPFLEELWRGWQAKKNGVEHAQSLQRIDREVSDPRPRSEPWKN